MNSKQTIIIISVYRAFTFIVPEVIGAHRRLSAEHGVRPSDPHGVRPARYHRGYGGGGINQSNDHLYANCVYEMICFPLRLETS